MMTVLMRSVEILVLLLLLVFSYYAKILDWMLILIAFLAVTAWVALHKESRDFSFSWSLGLYFSTNIFWWIIKQYRRSWYNNVFWATVGILMTMQLPVFYLLVRSVGELKPIWIFPISLAEVPLFSMTLDWALHRFGKQHRSYRETGLT